MGQSHAGLVLLWFHEFMARSCARDSILPHPPHPPGLRLVHLSSSTMFPEPGGVGYTKVQVKPSTAIHSPVKGSSDTRDTERLHDWMVTVLPLRKDLVLPRAFFSIS